MPAKQNLQVAYAIKIHVVISVSFLNSLMWFIFKLNYVTMNQQRILSCDRRTENQTKMLLLNYPGIIYFLKELEKQMY